MLRIASVFFIISCVVSYASAENHIIDSNYCLEVDGLDVLRADVFATPKTTKAPFGGFVGGENLNYPDWAIGNAFPGEEMTDDMMFLTYDGNWHERMRITDQGLIGIGTENPEYRLDLGLDEKSVLKSTNITSGLNDYMNFYVDTNNNSPGDYIAYQFNADVAVGESNALFTIMENGDVGIGTASPEEKLHVVGISYFDGRVGIGDATADMPLFVQQNEAGEMIGLFDGDTDWRIKINESHSLVIDPDRSYDRRVLIQNSGAGEMVLDVEGIVEAWEYVIDDTNWRIKTEESHNLVIDPDHSYDRKVIIQNSGAGEMVLDVEGIIEAWEYTTGDITFQKDGKKLWRMFEDEKGLYLENLNDGEVSRIFLEKDIVALKEDIVKKVTAEVIAKLGVQK
jgi:hypothetical protein